MSDKVSEHISFWEAIRSPVAIRYGIENLPTQEQFANMMLVAENIFEPLRDKFGVAIGVSSFFRCPELNKLIGGSKTSQHMKGEAIDIDADIFGLLDNEQIFHYIRRNLDFDQLIWEYNNPDGTPAWVHVSYKRKNNRKQTLRALRSQDGKIFYIPLE